MSKNIAINIKIYMFSRKQLSWEYKQCITAAVILGVNRVIFSSVTCPLCLIPGRRGVEVTPVIWWTRSAGKLQNGKHFYSWQSPDRLCRESRGGGNPITAHVGVGNQGLIKHTEWADSWSTTTLILLGLIPLLIYPRAFKSFYRVVYRFGWTKKGLILK